MKRSYLVESIREDEIFCGWLSCICRFTRDSKMPDNMNLYILVLYVRCHVIQLSCNEKTKLVKRIFQDVKGRIEELSGKTVSSLYSLSDLNEGGVSLIWLGTSGDKYWYRIFIDGWYCGVDRFEECDIEEDKDEGFEIIDYKASLTGCRIVEASISQPLISDRSIVFSLELETCKIELVCKNEDGDCVLLHNT